MEKKVIKIIFAVIFLISLMFAEYRYIMLNICPYLGENNTVYLEIFNNIDTYYAENIEG
jgi:hypothetical protein